MNRVPDTNRRARRWPVLVALAAVAAVVLFLWPRTDRRPPPEVAPPVTSQPAPIAEPEIRHPIEAVKIDPPPAGEPPAPLPPREASDSTLLEALAALVRESALAQFFFTDGLVRRFVVTIDNLPRETLPMRIRAIKAMPGSFAATGPEGQQAIDPANAKRYETFVGFVESIDARSFVSAYVRFYPLFQEEYRSIGFPKKHFNDRVVEAIDDLLAAPEPPAPIALVQPKVMFRYADPELESMSSGRKIMVRIGPENARKLKVKLREIRALLAGPAASAAR